MTADTVAAAQGGQPLQLDGRPAATCPGQLSERVSPAARMTRPAGARRPAEAPIC